MDIDMIGRFAATSIIAIFMVWTIYVLLDTRKAIWALLRSVHALLEIAKLGIEK